MKSIPRFACGVTEVRNLLSRGGAMSAAREIVEIWRAHGHDNVTAEIAPILSLQGMATGYWGVKTNLINGLPPR